jgi:hypothetical protein
MNLRYIENVHLEVRYSGCLGMNFKGWLQFQTNIRVIYIGEKMVAMGRIFLSVFMLSAYFVILLPSIHPDSLRLTQ